MPDGEFAPYVHTKYLITQASVAFAFLARTASLLAMYVFDDDIVIYLVQ